MSYIPSNKYDPDVITWATNIVTDSPEVWEKKKCPDFRSVSFDREIGRKTKAYPTRLLSCKCCAIQYHAIDPFVICHLMAKLRPTRIWNNSSVKSNNRHPSYNGIIYVSTADADAMSRKQPKCVRVVEGKKTWSEIFDFDWYQCCVNDIYAKHGHRYFWGLE